jgi:voltage-gated potassium channel
MDPAIRRVLSAVLLLLMVIFTGGVVVWLIGGGRWSLFETIYYAIYTVSTVGFSELPGTDSFAIVRVVTGVLILGGLGAIAFFQSTLTALLIEGVIGRAFRRRRMQKQLESLSGHFVVAGCGRTGKYVVEELAQIGQRFVAIDRDEDMLMRLSEEIGGGLLYVVGDATEDHTLVAAGVKRAAGVVSALSDDRDNLFITLSVRTLNPSARIISKAVEIENEVKLSRAGADSTVSPNRVGAHRLVSELVRPEATAFLDHLRVDRDLNFEFVEMPAKSSWAGKSLRAIPIRDRTNLLVLALRESDGNYVYNPAPGQVVEAGVQFIVIGEHANVDKLRALLDGD